MQNNGDAREREREREINREITLIIKQFRAVFYSRMQASFPSVAELYKHRDFAVLNRTLFLQNVLYFI